MKNNKAFTIIEFTIVIFILILISLIVVPFLKMVGIGNIVKFLLWSLVYFTVPTIILGIFLKLNQKYKWIVRRKNPQYLHKRNYFIDFENNDCNPDKNYSDANILYMNLIALFILWPIYVPCVVTWIVGKKMYYRRIKPFFINLYDAKDSYFRIPTDNE